MAEIHEFFAVTRNSLYRVTDQKDPTGTPIVKKITLKDPSRTDQEKRLHDGSLAGITKDCIVVYDEDHLIAKGEHPLRPEMVNIEFWGGNTSPVVALFLDEQKARKCSATDDSQ